MTSPREEGVSLPKKLGPIFQGSADVRGAWGGRGSGKTRSFAKMTAVRAYMWERAARSGIILCGRQFMNSLRDSSFDEIKQAILSEPWLAEAFDIGDKFIRTKSKRIEYVFMGLDRNVDSIKSKSRILLAWLDEAEPITEAAYIKLIPTLREEDSELWVTWNPESKRSPTHKRFRETSGDPRVKIAEINHRDNPWFPAILDRTRSRDLVERPQQYDHIWEGGFAHIFTGAYYAAEMNQARIDGRIGDFPYSPELPVHTAWDLGVGDSTAIWFFQIIGNEIRIIDFYENHNCGLPHYVEVLDNKNYVYGDDWVPHDAKVTEWGTGRTRIEQMVELKRRIARVPHHKIDDGINAVRTAMRRCFFHGATTEAGLDALRQYRTEYDDDKQAFNDKPRHDWTSHAADAFRYLAMAYREITEPKREEEKPFGIGLIEMSIDQFFEFSDETNQRRERV